MIRLLRHLLHHRAAYLGVIFQQLVAGQVFDDARPDGVPENICDGAEAVPEVRQRGMKGMGGEKS